MTLYLPVGPPGAGKSTLAALAVDAKLITLDAIVSPDRQREILTGHIGNQHENGAVFAIVGMTVKTRLRNDLPVWLDATNARSEYQSELLVAATRYGTTVVSILFEVDESEVRRRNALRDHPVPDDVMARMFETFRGVTRESLPGHVFTDTEFRDALEHNRTRRTDEGGDRRACRS